MSIDEAIEHAIEIANCCKNQISTFPNPEPYEEYCNGELEKCADEHEQLAEWLEELKYHKSLLENTKTTNPMYEVGYNKGIDDFMNMALEMIKSEQDTRYGYLDGMDIREIARELKGGVKNEMDRQCR